MARVPLEVIGAFKIGQLEFERSGYYYGPRKPDFGIVHVNFESQKRTPKDSARFYSQVIATRGRVLEEASTRID